MMDWDRERHGFIGGGAPLLMAILCVVVIALAVWVLARMVRPREQVEMRESPRQILDRRLASGEIDAKAYAQLRKSLESPTP